MLFVLHVLNKLYLYIEKLKICLYFKTISSSEEAFKSECVLYICTLTLKTFSVSTLQKTTINQSSCSLKLKVVIHLCGTHVVRGNR